ncbi:hypothetical protein FH972_020013 [Carpinus fangiana]|uniref:Uncharacterized protein n=1 Tax=Carpinus fangiana TaxID=176857 RepID=A0A5N6RV40_9ROSI|nr:hypothetical protein FH972_020013 [Carpinus fangiana]
MGAIEPTSPPPYPAAATAASLLVYTDCPAKICSRKASPSPSGGLPAMFLRERGCVDDVYSKKENALPHFLPFRPFSYNFLTELSLLCLDHFRAFSSLSSTTASAVQAPPPAVHRDS